MEPLFSSIFTLSNCFSFKFLSFMKKRVTINIKNILPHCSKLCTNISRKGKVLFPGMNTWFQEQGVSKKGEIFDLWTFLAALRSANVICLFTSAHLETIFVHSHASWHFWNKTGCLRALLSPQIWPHRLMSTAPLLRASPCLYYTLSTFTSQSAWMEMKLPVF